MATVQGIGQLTLYDQNDAIVAGSQPTGTLTVGQLWLDTSTTPNVLKRWDGANWIKASATTASEVGAYTKTETDNKVNAVTVGGTNLLINSKFKDDFDSWNNSGGNTIVTEDGYQAGKIVGALTTTKYVQQPVTKKLLDNTEYTLSAWVKVKSIVKGTTNPFIQLYIDGYTNEATSVWFGASTVSGSPDLSNLTNNTWVKVVWTFKITKAKSLWKYVNFYVYARDFTGEVYFRDVQLELGNKATDYSPAPEDIYADTSVPFRYIRYTGRGNNVNANSHLVEIQVFDYVGTNLAQGKPVTSGNASATNLAYITNGTIDTTQYSDLGSGTPDQQNAVIDLGSICYNSRDIQIWHYWTGSRQYYFDLSVSQDGVTWMSLYDTERDGNYTVSSSGFSISTHQSVVTYSNTALIQQTYDMVSTKAEASVVDDLGTRLSTAEEAIKADAIVSTVMSHDDFATAMGNKADSSALDGKADASDVQGIKDDLKNNYDTRITALEQTAEGFDFKIQKAGGVNLIKNSVGYVGTDFWYWVYTDTSISNLPDDDALDRLGFGNGFYYPPNGLNKGIHQDINVEVGQSYTLSWYLNKLTKNPSTTYNSAYRFYVQIQELVGTTWTTKKEIPTNDQFTTDGYEFNSLTYTPTAPVIRVRFIGFGSVEAKLSGIMLNVGEHPLQWSLAVGEVYNTNIQMDSNGIRVQASDYDGYTAITPQEFAGYYNTGDGYEEVFTLNKDTTEVSKLEAKNEISMNPIKVVPIKTATLNGWAFVADME
ncbi:hypothetical protein V7128_07330 [Neobacillus vireti]|uniref:hypothetical protein n=1 Tax=Neobacillus vireti TaxID=220686 RepID=UPI002FFF4392